MLIQPFSWYQVGGIFTFTLTFPFNKWRGYMGAGGEAAAQSRQMSSSAVNIQINLDLEVFHQAGKLEGIFP